MAEKPRLVASGAGGRASTWPPSGLNHSAVEIRFQLLEPPGQAVTGEACAEKGKINLRHGR